MAGDGGGRRGGGCRRRCTRRCGRRGGRRRRGLGWGREDAIRTFGDSDLERILRVLGLRARPEAPDLLAGRLCEAVRARGGRGAGGGRCRGARARSGRRAGRRFRLRSDLDAGEERVGLCSAREALDLLALPVDDADLGRLVLYLEALQHVSDVVLGLGAPMDQVFAFQAEEIGWSPAHRRVGAARDLHLDRVPRQRDVGFTHSERVHSVPDVLERLFHHVLRRPFGGGQDHGGSTLEVESECRAQAPAEESHRGGSHEDQDEDDGRPEGAIASHASSAPLITSRKRASSNSAA